MRKIASIITVFVVSVLLAFTAFADDPGTMQATNDEQKKQEYAEANVVLDFYCIGIYNGTGYELTPAYAEMDLTETNADAMAQQAMELTFKEGSTAVPAVTGAALDVKVTDLPLGMYLVLPHGSDLTADKYVKTVNDEEGNAIKITIAQTDTKEIRFKPILISMDYNNADGEFQVKGETIPRYGKLRITKIAERYNSAHPVTVVFQLHIENPDGTVKEDVAGLTLNGTGKGYVDVTHLQIGAKVTVTEIYSGSDLLQISENPAPVVIEEDKTATVAVGGQDTTETEPQGVSFTNRLPDNPPDDHGHGFTNRFEFDGKTWDWYKDGVLQTAEE